MEQNREENRDKRLNNLIPWKKGNPSPNPNGRPKGKRNFDTIYEAALEKLAKLNNTTPEALEDEIISKGIIESRKGQYNFWRDMLDRRHGRALQQTDITTNGESINPVLVKFIDGKNN